ncbi:hypothetical protein U2261_14140 [Achromobacter xylosoxidans]|jgi:hypothetical protein|uniref:Hyp domain-containing protein 1 n=1 Tax=Alcaligenes xylosoxydans xylosoxydans TaxID=85698 RepID=A0A0D6GVJ6_ALCXX|nr:MULTISPECIES: hypothetical protein [Achromobacter]AHC46192.1 hypothetical protein AX27061_1727 [Achromobacter xylosoxidans NBRC 15126 = ATCC 27061]AMH06436.1 hypothetical protein AL509_20995 [Achromobacter xylosoxidans]AXA76449.1 hypothetical protein CE206_08215 [Achromobacter xylosoxidans]EFV83413.1 hypothetical protein HMPREF0005_01758 [Achromobacter xylosoxidans C54]KAA5921152.1 hypothetical protein F1536_22085 [Achromobacter xylosoxidans]
MFARLALASALLALLTACSSMSEVTPTGKNSYSVTYSSGTQLLTWVEIKNQALQRADQYCQSIGRKLQKPAITSNHATGLGSKRATVTFECGEVPPPKSAPQQ